MISRAVGRRAPSRIAGVIAVLLLAQAAQAQIGNWKPAVVRQADAAREFAPVEVRLAARESGAGEQVVKLRIWAARDYRNQTLHWQERVRRMVARANAAFQAWPRVRFEIAELRSWDIDSDGVRFETLLAQLESMDKGEDVDLTVGLAAADPTTAPSIHQLGMARLAGRHMILRNQNDLKENEAIQSAMDLLLPSTRDQLFIERKAHKELVVFLHEWAHTAGALHVDDPADLMNERYDHHQAKLEGWNVAIVDLYLKKRGGPKGEWREELRRLAERAPASAWLAGDQRDLIATLGPPKGKPAENSLSSENVAAFNQAVALHGAGQFTKALIALRPLQVERPDDPRVQALWCELVLRASSGHPERLTAIDAACRRAAKLAPADPWPQLLLAQAHIVALDDAGAVTPLSRAHQILDYDKTATPGAWGLLGQLYLRAWSPALACQAAGHADEKVAAEILRDAAVLRHRFALPGAAEAEAQGVDAHEERAFLKRQNEIRDRIREGRMGDAEQLVKGFEESFPHSPAAPAQRALLLYSSGRFDQASKLYAEALLRDGDYATAHLFAGLIAAREGHGREKANHRGAVLHLQRAIELDPETPDAWSALAELFRREKNRAALEKLAADHLARFHTPLER